MRDTRNSLCAQILCIHKFSVCTNSLHTHSLCAQILPIHNIHKYKFIHKFSTYTNSLHTQILCVCTNPSHTQYFCRDTQILCIHKFSVNTISLHVQCTTTAVHTSIITCMHDVLVHSRPLPLHSGQSVINLPWLLGGCQKDCML